MTVLSRMCKAQLRHLLACFFNWSSVLGFTSRKSTTEFIELLFLCVLILFSLGYFVSILCS